jgi:hypothetical protein
MKSILLFIAFSSLFIIFTGRHSFAQEDTTQTFQNKLYIITTSDGSAFYGHIISQDSREVLIETKDLGQISIPKYQIKEMKELKQGDLSAKGQYIPIEAFSTRYFITTNGLPLEERESYILWNLWGPDFEFGVTKDLTVGLMTSWIGVPIIGSVKYSIELGQKTSMAIGGLLGWGTYMNPSFGIALPYTAFTYGDRRSNITFSGGYGAVFLEGDANGRVLLSVAGMTKVGKKVSVVFDSFIVPPINNLEGGALLIPGIRLQTDKNKTFQFGFGMLILDGTFEPYPIPFIQFFRKL